MQTVYTAHTAVADRGLQAAKHPSTSASQNGAINIPRKTPEKWPPWFAHKPKEERSIDSQQNFPTE